MSENIDLQGSINSKVNLMANITNETNLNGNIVTGQTKVSTNDHNLLINRDLPNQHPIEAITGLKEELLSIKTSSKLWVSPLDLYSTSQWTYSLVLLSLS